MSITELTTASAWMAGLAIVALIAAGWRKPARASTAARRARRSPRRSGGVQIEEVPALLHHSTPLWRRIWAVIASSMLAVVTGAVLATVIAFGLALAVITLTTMLRQ